jgi:hypothetical protein
MNVLYGVLLFGGLVVGGLCVAWWLRRAQLRELERRDNG